MLRSAAGRPLSQDTDKKRHFSGNVSAGSPAKLPELDPGDIIDIAAADGQRFS